MKKILIFLISYAVAFGILAAVIHFSNKTDLSILLHQHFFVASVGRLADICISKVYCIWCSGIIYSSLSCSQICYRQYR